MLTKKWQEIIIKTPQGNVEGKAPIIISASRATDIPAFYPEWFMNRIDKGYIKWTNKFNNKAMYVSLEKMRAIVFWTKNAEPMMQYLPRIDEKGINYYFTYTLNDYEAENLEPHVPPLKKRIETFKRLSDTIGKERVVWRFDPLILTDTITVDRLLDKIHGIGRGIHDHTEKLVISFIDINVYKKVKRNLIGAGLHDCKEFTPEDMTGLAKGLQNLNREWNLEIATCTEETDLSAFGIIHNRCIDDDLMVRLFSRDRQLMDFLGYPEDGLLPVRRAKLKDQGQRKYCGCFPSKDIGQYDTCIYGCLYCYANASLKIAQEHFKRHKEKGEFGESIY